MIRVLHARAKGIWSVIFNAIGISLHVESGGSRDTLLKLDGACRDAKGDGSESGECGEELDHCEIERARVEVRESNPM